MRNWSHYQLDVFNAVENSNDNLFVAALAGSGKTTVLEEVNHRIPLLNELCMPINVVNTCFNVHIRTALQEKIKRGEIATLNSLGWGPYRQNVQGVIFNEYKNLNFLRKQFSSSDDDQKLFKKIRTTVCRVVSLFKQLNYQEFPDNWISVCDTYGIETGDFKPEDDIAYWIGKVFDYSINNFNMADYDDQIYQVIRQGWAIRRRDIALVDEAQDLSPLQIEFDLRLGERLIAVGDRHQAIYVFRGADIHAIDNLVKATNAVTLPLSISYRCPKEVIRFAQQYVPEIEYHEDAIEGLVEDINLDDFWQTVDSNDYVTCRNTAPLVSKCLAAIRLKKKAFVRGRDIGKNLYSLIEKIDELSPTRNTLDFLRAANGYRLEQIERLQATGRDVEAISVDDKIQTIMALAEECDYVEDIRLVIDKIFSDENKEGIEFSTIHKSKGREKPRVFRLRQDLCPHRRTPSHLLEIERNIKYVEITRAQEALYTIIEPK